MNTPVDAVVVFFRLSVFQKIAYLLIDLPKG